MKTERFVVRSAYGIFYDENILNLNILPRFNPPFVDISAFGQLYRNQCHSGHLEPARDCRSPRPILFPRNFRDAYMQDWNVDLQYEVQPNWMIDLAYVGTKGTHLPATRDMNEANPSPRLLPTRSSARFWWWSRAPIASTTPCSSVPRSA